MSKTGTLLSVAEDQEGADIKIVTPNNPLPTRYGDSPSVDAFGRLRTSEPFGIFDNKNISTRNRNQWEEMIDGAILVYSGLTGTFQAAEEIRGVLPTGFFAIGTVVSDNGTDSMVFNCNHNDFQIGDTVTGQVSGATATVVSANTGSDAQHDYNTASVLLTAGTGATDKSVRQTHRYHAYVPGKSQLVLCTFVMGAAKANVAKRVGLFDDLNGLFLEQNGTTDIALVRRTSTSGAAVDNRIVRSDPVNPWNLDNLDGAGPSKITLDLTKTLILVIDFQWLGVGRVRYGFDIDGAVIYVHEELNANNLTTVYMRTPTLPLRYEVANTAPSASATSMNEICCSVGSEGGYALPGLEFSVSSGIIAKSVGTTLIPIFAIRQKTEFPAGKPNRRIAKFLRAALLGETDDSYIEIRHVHEAVDMTATWTDVGGGSAIEYSTDISAVTGRPFHVIELDYLPTAQGNKATASAVSGEFINLHSFISQNAGATNSELLIIYAQAFSGTATIRRGLTWIEFD